VPSVQGGAEASHDGGAASFVCAALVLHPLSSQRRWLEAQLLGVALAQIKCGR